MLIHFLEMNSIEDLHKLGSLFEDFVYRKDLKRKQLDDDSSDHPVTKKARAVHSLDYDSYKERVSSFSDPSWCQYSHVSSCYLLPQHLARYGWVAKNMPDQDRFVQCVSCRENLYLRLPEMTATTFKAMVAKQEERVSGGHAEFCPWSSSPSPVSWSSPSSDRQDIVNTASTLLTLGTDLPWVMEETLEQFSDANKIISDTVRKQGRDNVDTKVLETASLLAILGWQKGSLEDTLTDCFKVRRIGLWNFVSIQSELDRVEDLRVARELSGDVGDQTLKKDETDRKYFDPLREHVVWNPVIVKDEAGLEGWRTVINGLTSGENEKTKSPMKSTSSDDSPEKLSSAQTVLNKVRALLDLW